MLVDEGLAETGVGSSRVDRRSSCGVCVCVCVCVCMCVCAHTKPLVGFRAAYYKKHCQ